MKSKFVIMLAIVFSFILATKSAQATIIEPPTDSNPPEVKEDCKKNGWADRTVIIDGVTYKFKNQGDCMSYLVTSDNVNVNEPALIVN